MDSKKFSVYNPAKGSYVSAGVTVIDTTSEPLRVLKVMIEGLALNAETGLWLTPLQGIPKVPRLSPFDLVYLDSENRVVKGAELLPGVDFPDFNGEAASALVLPFRTISSSKTESGDQLTLQSVEETEVESTPSTESTLHEPDALPVTLADEAQSSRDVETPNPGLGSGPDLFTFPFVEDEAESSEEEDDASIISRALRLAEEEHLLEASPRSSVVKPHGKEEESQATPFVSQREVAPVQQEQSAARPATSPELEDSQKDSSEVRKDDPLDAARKRLAVEIERQRKRIAAQKESAAKVAPAPARLSPKPAKDTPTRPAVSPRLPSPGTKGRGIKGRGIPQADGAELESTVTRALRWLYPDAFPLPNRRGALRCPMPELVAYHWIDGEPRAHQIGDISSTGVYLLTEKRWPRGELISLTLQRKGPPEHSSERRVKMKAEAVRWGKEGIALRFVFPTGMDLRLWEGRPKSGEVRGSEYVMHEVRLAKALAFVFRICPLVGDGIGQLLQKELSTYRKAGAIEIALYAEEFLAFEPNYENLRAHPALVLRVLEVGSWADLDFIRKLWAGLLVTSCSVDGNDESNLVFVDTLSILTPIHFRILTDAWAKAIKIKLERGRIPKDSIHCTPEEIAKVTGTNDLTKIHRAVMQLSDLGLLESPSALSFTSETKDFKTTPTPLGMQMYARCNRYPGEI